MGKKTNEEVKPEEDGTLSGPRAKKLIARSGLLQRKCENR